ncbi:hypothetical protein [Agrobacterium sp. CG674]
MKGNIRATNFQKVKIELRNLATRVPEAARKVMHKSADEIVRVAKIQAPRDWGNLENAIKQLSSYGDRGRLQIDIGISPDGNETGENGPIDVNQYAVLIHENYENVIRVNGPGKETRKKMRQYPKYRIGSGFLTRAAMAEQKKIQPQMISTIDQIILEETTT